MTGPDRTIWQPDGTTKEEFFVKDHLGNVRSVVDVYEYPILTYLGTYELASANLENLFFEHHGEIRDDKPGSTDSTDTEAGRLNGADPDRRIGTALLMKVMSGDKVEMNVNSFYDSYDPQEDAPVSGEDMLGSLVSTLVGGSGGLEGGESHDPGMVDQLFSPENYASAEEFLHQNIDTTKPKAFLNYVLFDEQMRVVSTFTGAFQATGNGTWAEIGTTAPLVIPVNGFLSVYLSNETAVLCDGCMVEHGDVFFDDVVIRFIRGNLKEENHYYPFGLPMGDMGSAAAGFTPNRRKYQSNEYIKEAGLNWMDFHARQYDPQIGRFLSVDPLAAVGGQDVMSPYAAMGNEWAAMTDPDGMMQGVFFIQSGRDWPEMNYNQQFDRHCLDILFGGDGITGDIARSSGWSCGFASGHGGAFWYTTWCGMTGEQLENYCAHASPEVQAEILSAVYHTGYYQGVYQRNQDMANNYSSGGDGHFSINLSTMAWYDGDGDGKAGIGGNNPMSQTPIGPFTTDDQYVEKYGDGIDEATERSKLEIADIMINATGLAFSTQRYLFDLAIKSDVSINNIGFIKGFKRIGFLTDVASLAITASDIGQYGFNADNGTGAAAGVMAFYPGGWIISPLLSIDKWFTTFYFGPSNTWGRPVFIDSHLPNSQEPNSNHL